MTPLLAAAFVYQSTLTVDLTQILADPLLSRGTVSVLVKELAGPVVFDMNSEKRLIPASALKTTTVAACLNRFGSTASLKTYYWKLGDDAYVLGGWDPLLTIEDLLSIKEKLGSIRRLYFWDAHDEDDAVNGDWQRDDSSNEDGAPITSLTVNRGRAELFQVDGRLVLRPRNFGMTVKREAATGDLRIRRGEGSWTVRVWGKLPDGDVRLGTISLPDPALCAARVIHPSAERKRMQREQSASCFERAFGDVARVVMVESNNHAADSLLRWFGAANGNSAWGASTSAVMQFLNRIGVSSEAMRIADGSGLSRFNELSARALVTTIEWSLRSNEAAAFASYFARAGEGTLRGRLDGLDVRAKTGTMTGVSALAGWLDTTSATTREGPKVEALGSPRRFLFAIVFNHYPGRAADVRPIQDAFLRRLNEGG